MLVQGAYRAVLNRQGFTLAEKRKYQSEATVKCYQKLKADAEAGDPDAIKRYETTLAKRREEYHRKKGA